MFPTSGASLLCYAFQSFCCKSWDRKACTFIEKNRLQAVYTYSSRFLSLGSSNLPTKLAAIGSNFPNTRGLGTKDHSNYGIWGSQLHIWALGSLRCIMLLEGVLLRLEGLLRVSPTTRLCQGREVMFDSHYPPYCIEQHETGWDSGKLAGVHQSCLPRTPRTHKLHDRESENHTTKIAIPLEGTDTTTPHT